MVSKLPRSLGSIYTPPDFACLLSKWAIQNSSHKVLDIGVGEGAFTFAAYDRLVHLGADPEAARNQIHGAELYRPAYNNFNKKASTLEAVFPNVQFGDFFRLNFPQVDAVLGNPPYVRRSDINNVDDIRENVLGENASINVDVSRLSDLYIYFLLQAASYLKAGGRMAVITADSWLNARYGVAFKKFLQEQFRIDSLVSLDRQVFDAEVKPVLMFATKIKTHFNQKTRFIRIKNGLPVGNLLQVIKPPYRSNSDVIISAVKTSELESTQPWSVNFKAPDVYEELVSHELMTPLSNVAKTSIGLQTLAKEFFVLTPERARANQIESEYLVPLALSSRYHKAPTIEHQDSPVFYLFYCSKSKEELRGTHALRYIEEAESKVVPVRGKNVTVIGYQNKERIKRSKRKFWFDLRTALEQRERGAILIPRLIYRSFMVVWNRAKFIPGELFIECLPLTNLGVDIEVYLAILSSSLTEIGLRSYAQLYGGGTYNISPGQIGKVPVLNVALLSEQHKIELKQAYLHYLADDKYDRSVIDKVLYKQLGFTRPMQKRLTQTLDDLISIAISSAKPGSIRD